MKVADQISWKRKEQKKTNSSWGKKERLFATGKETQRKWLGAGFACAVAPDAGRPGRSTAASTNFDQ